MSDGPESELEVALDRVRSLPPIVDPRDAVVRAAVLYLDARDHFAECEPDDIMTALTRMHDAHEALRAAVAAYVVGGGR